ncbi:MAG: flagellar motor switch protein FliM [Bacillaceae bacterium]|jgi:flagellar motor switch protein FliM|uniref:Flagellar motor switch protein FliM n=2 Tax=Aeribacillus TaxID=1055323 RepID=A0A164BZ13_9BACI|nr:MULTISPECIES: flagellar motor switch protein FliM [Aeribacillus]AXI39833.1 flagellar motor switch protein FliM [Bacillaceae bacterium ZC4]REJ19510.1 MAG: flagellar motor switch protein FliM [Bacillaceae bacterium]KZM57969.1 flagellar motor switch protein FliM [Aeribacillus pallidus]KZN97606.1 flagellar motor switch protein FliM [Aeribacillus pallidus]MDR9791895.1 flagellar motor switch protein FliM [Aeribacillus pallidus]
MSNEILSQSEIDALLSALTTGEMNVDELKKEEEAKKIKVYDFKRALRFSKDQIRSITRVHENFARLLTTYFAAQLRTYVQITVTSVDQLPYEEFVRSIPKMTVLNVFELGTLDGRIIMEVNPNIAYAMMDRLMGGFGASMNKIEQLTEIEMKIIASIFEKTLEHYREAWSTILDIEPCMQEFEVNPQFLQMVSPNDTVVVISLNTQVGEASGMINLCIPHVVLEPIIPKLSVHYWMQSERKAQNSVETEVIKNRIKLAEVPVVAELGTSVVTVQEFLEMRVGDMIRLDQSTSDPLVIKVGDVPKFFGQPGKKNKKLAVQILGHIERGDEADD